MQGFARTIGHSVSIRTPSTAPSRASVYNATPEADSGESVIGATQLFRELRRSKGFGDAMVPLHELFPILHSCTAPLRAAVVEVLAETRVLMESVNKRRYARGSNAHTAECLESLEASTARLSSALDAFKTKDRLALLEPFAPYLDPDAGEELLKAGATPFRSLFLTYVFAANLVTVAAAVQALAQSVSQTAHKRPKNRLWAPGAIALGKLLGRRKRGEGGAEDDAGGQAALGEAPQVPDGGDWEREEEVYRKSCRVLWIDGILGLMHARSIGRDPDGRPPSNPMQYIMNGIHRAWVWAQTPEALVSSCLISCAISFTNHAMQFAFKMVFITIALWVPSVCRSSASECLDVCWL